VNVKRLSATGHCWIRNRARAREDVVGLGAAPLLRPRVARKTGEFATPVQQDLSGRLRVDAPVWVIPARVVIAQRVDSVSAVFRMALRSRLSLLLVFNARIVANLDFSKKLNNRHSINTWIRSRSKAPKAIQDAEIISVESNLVIYFVCRRVEAPRPFTFKNPRVAF
jgi:hypothetical protein